MFYFFGWVCESESDQNSIAINEIIILENETEYDENTDIFKIKIEAPAKYVIDPTKITFIGEIPL